MRKPSFYPSTIAGTPENSNYPYGQYKDAKNGAGGTKMEAAHINDIAYALLTVLHNAGIEPDDTLENTNSSQFMQALNKIYDKEWSSDKASKGGYKVGAKILQNGIEYINQIPNNTSEPAAQTKLLGTIQATSSQQTWGIQGNGWQIIKDHNTGQTLQNWLMPKSGETVPYKIFAQDGTTNLLTVVPAPEIRSFLYEPKNMDEIAKLGYFPLTLNADGTEKVFPDTNNILSEVQKEILGRYVSAGYIKLVDNAYSIALANLKAGFGLVGFGGQNPIGSPTGGMADNAPNHIINHVAPFTPLFVNYEGVHQFDLRIGASYRSFPTNSSITEQQPYHIKDETGKPGVQIFLGGGGNGSNPGTVNTWEMNDTENLFLAVSCGEDKSNRKVAFPMEKFETNGGAIDKAWADQYPNTSAGLQVCYGIPISTAYKH